MFIYSLEFAFLIRIQTLIGWKLIQASVQLLNPWPLTRACTKLKKANWTMPRSQRCPPIHIDRQAWKVRYTLTDSTAQLFHDRLDSYERENKNRSKIRTDVRKMFFRRKIMLLESRGYRILNIIYNVILRI